MITTRGGDERSPDILAFLDEIADVCRRHDMTLGHEDSHGTFLVERDGNTTWLLQAREVVSED